MSHRERAPEREDVAPLALFSQLRVARGPCPLAAPHFLAYFCWRRRRRGTENLSSATRFLGSSILLRWFQLIE